ncbi:RNA helicase [Vermiconidia calcicola]|uniref:RNA helicase n=1 Tax=Vermiconidia calcicola TaxID=1690605 RepID=A0ACC3MQY0_9PEZI|nr:RNA helicase [Vermiconidia calcicola]
MLRSLCPFCEARAFAKVFNPSWQHSRTAATLQKRKPSRMTLSPNVRRGPPPAAIQGAPKAKPKSRNSPFGGMNMTTIPRELENISIRKPASRTERRRAPRFEKNNTTSQSRTGGKDGRDRADPMHALKMQRALTNISYEKRSRVKQTIMERDSFDEFDLLPSVKESIASQALGGMVGVSPTPIQRLALPALLGMEDKKKGKGRKEGGEMQQFLLAAETGSGKTLAYLLPVIDAIKRSEAFEARAAAREDKQNPTTPARPNTTQLFTVAPPPLDSPDPSTARPKALILVPTSELVSQIGNLVKSLSHTIKFRSALLSAAYSGKVIRSRLFSTGGIDIVITTPHLLHSVTESDPNVLSHVTHLVVDEADSLLDRSFAPITSSIIDRCAPSLRQLIFCSATIPRSLDSYMQKRYPAIRRLVTPNLHAVPRRVQLSVVDIEKVPYQGNRDLACAQVVWEIGKEGNEEESREKKIVVFVNEREKTDELARYLRGKGIDAHALSRDSQDRTEDILAGFTGLLPSHSPTAQPKPTSHASMTTAISPADLAHTTTTTFTPDRPSTSRSPSSSPSNPRSSSSPAGRTSLPHTKVLITTDLLSRGIDTLPVKHVILYDVPHTSIDFIHRLGRVGRMGRRGRGVVLVGKGDRRDVVREVREGMFKGMALI